MYIILGQVQAISMFSCFFFLLTTIFHPFNTNKPTPADTNFVRMYKEGGSVWLGMYGCVFRGREGPKFRFFCVHNIWMFPKVMAMTG